MKVMKFGGSSIGSAKKIRNVAGLIGGTGKDIVVLSAVEGTTNTLREAAGYLVNRNTEGARDTLSHLESFYRETITELYFSEEYASKALECINGNFKFLHNLTKQLFTSREEKIMVAQGELISSRLMTLYLQEQGVRAVLIPALDFMRTDLHGEPDTDYIRGHLLPILDSCKDADIFITQGYICRNAHDDVDNLLHGGSDYTAALVGAATGAEEIQIWTDKESSITARHLNFDEAAELGCFGAEILHPTCIQPARFADIPVRLLSTVRPDSPGTLINNEPDPKAFKAVAAKGNITAIRIRSSRMLLAYGFLRKVFEIFESYQTSIDMICTSEVGVSLSIDDTRHLNEIVHDLKKYGTVSVDLDMCMVCVVGNMDWKYAGVEARVMEAVKDVQVRMVSFGGSDCNISLLVKEEDRERTIESLEKCLF